jgi:hypothetical protein
MSKADIHKTRKQLARDLNGIKKYIVSKDQKLLKRSIDLITPDDNIHEGKAQQKKFSRLVQDLVNVGNSMLNLPKGNKQQEQHLKQ